jgi:hypothetical protein
MGVGSTMPEILRTTTFATWASRLASWNERRIAFGEIGFSTCHRSTDITNSGSLMIHIRLRSASSQGIEPGSIWHGSPEEGDGLGTSGDETEGWRRATNAEISGTVTPSAFPQSSA